MSTEWAHRKNKPSCKLTGLMGHILDGAISTMAYIAMVLLAFAWLSVCADVICRYFLSRPIPWATEVTEYILLQITLLGAAWLLRKEGHVNVDALTTHLSQKTQAILNVIISYICALVCLIVAWYGITVVHLLFQEQSIIPKQLEIRKYIVYSVIPLGYLVLCGQFIRRGHRFFRTWKSLHDQ